MLELKKWKYLHFDNCRHGSVAVFCQSGFTIDIIKLYE